MKKLTVFIREAWHLVKELWAEWQFYPPKGRPLVLLPEDDLKSNRFWTACQDRDYKLMQECIMQTITGGHSSACDYCEDKDECERAKAVGGRGCIDWYLKMMDKEEIHAARVKAGIEKEGEKDEQSAAESGGESNAEVQTGTDPGAEGGQAL